MISPKLEYAAALQSPHKKEDIRKTEDTKASNQDSTKLEKSLIRRDWKVSLITLKERK